MRDDNSPEGVYQRAGEEQFDAALVAAKAEGAKEEQERAAPELARLRRIVELARIASAAMDSDSLPDDTVNDATFALADALADHLKPEAGK